MDIATPQYGFGEEALSFMLASVHNFNPSNSARSHCDIDWFEFKID